MNFDRLAPVYQVLETIIFGHALQRARTLWIGKIARPNRVLIVGEGNGRFLREFVRIYPKIDIDSVDASARMLQLSQARLHRYCPESLAHIGFHHADIRAWSPSQSYDLVVTHFFLDCFERDELVSILAKLAGCATANATWLISDFALPRQGVARVRSAICLKLMYAFFRLTTGINADELVDPQPYLETHGFVRRVKQLFRSGLLSACVYSRA